MSMVSIQNGNKEPGDIWTALAAPIPAGEVQWRQNGRPKARDGKFFAPFVAYIDAQFVRDRFDAVVPGEWDLHLELLPPLLATGGDGEANDQPCAFKARLQVLGVIREDVGSGHDYKQASTDAFKRAAVRFGIGRELYTDYEIVWVQVDSDGKYAKPLEDPAVAFARKRGKPVVSAARTESPVAPDTQPAPRADGGLASPASSAPAESVRMPFGKHKGQPLGEIDEADLVSTIQWATKTDKVKFAELIANCQAVIDRRAGSQADAFGSDEVPF